MERAVITATKACAVRLLASLARFGRDCRGVSALEFSILAPVLLALYLGSNEVTQGITIKRKVELTAHALADLTSQQTSINNADMTNIFNAASAIIAPYNAANLTAVVSEISIDANGQGTVVWSSATSNGTALSAGQSVTLPPSLATPNSYLILGQAAYSYNPTYGYVLTNTLTLSDQIFMLPRQTNSVTRVNS